MDDTYDDEPAPSTRFFWWTARNNALTYPWQPFYWGGDEHCNTTIGLRLPGGVLFMCVNLRLRNADSPPCKRCTADGLTD